MALSNVILALALLGPVDFRNPPRRYEARVIGDLQVSVERQLLQDRPDVARRALERLARERNEAIASLPASARAELRAVPFFLMEGPRAREGGRDNGLEYFKKGAPSFHAELDPRWSHCVVVYHAENYTKLSEIWALKALVHEFAHEYQLTRWAEKYPPILEAWTHARALGLYRNVRDDEGKLHDLAYAGVNQLEYFAELSCMYFVHCNYPPHDRGELEAYDPKGAAMVRRLWLGEPAA